MPADMNMTEKPARTIRTPVQARSRKRFEAILDAAERLLVDHEPIEVSIYRLASDTGISAPSIYHFFPDQSLVVIALAERYLARFASLLPPDYIEPDVAAWQDVINSIFGAALRQYRAHPAAQKILLSPSYTAEIRAMDLRNNDLLATLIIDTLRQRFVIGDIPQLHDRFVELIVINDAMWRLSIERHGAITDAMEEASSRARIAYCRTFLPEYLQVRTAEGSD